MEEKKEKKEKKLKVLTCKVGDVVLHRGIRMWVSQVIDKGEEDKPGKEEGETIWGNRSCITACRIMENGQILFRSPQPIEHTWRHPEPRERIKDPRAKVKKKKTRYGERKNWGA